MPIHPADARKVLLENLNRQQRAAVGSESRRLLVVAGAGSGKTEVMARRVAWWVSVNGVPKDEIIAFTFTEAASEELKFRIRSWLERIAQTDDDRTLGGMYIGTIHGFCLKALRDFAPDEFYMFDVIDDAGRMALIEQGYNGVLALRRFQQAANEAEVARGKFQAQELFLRGYDLLNEYGKLDVSLPGAPIPVDVATDKEWCKSAELTTDVGTSDVASAFSDSAARYYAYLRTRRFLDFSTIQSEVVKRLHTVSGFRENLRKSWSRLVVDEVQDINPVQYELISAIAGDECYLTAVGDHRQAIYSFRGGRVDLMGHLYSELEASEDGHIQELPANYRSTPRIIALSNRWADTIEDTAEMPTPAMEHHRESRLDISGRHVAQLHFDSREEEAEWIADTIADLVRVDGDTLTGAYHDDREGSRGLALSDIAVLVRSGTNIRTYQEALRMKGIPAVVRGGPDLFSQPEVLLLLGALGLCSDLNEFLGQADNPRSMPGRIRNVLGVGPQASLVIPAAIATLRERGLNVPNGTSERLTTLCHAIKHRLESAEPQPEDIAKLNCDRECRKWLQRTRKPRRLFPQTIFHWLLREAGVAYWSADGNRAVAESSLFHLGQLSSLVKSIETSGWTPADSLKWQLVALISWGAGAARTAEAPLLVSPDAVSITTIHSAKGLEFAAVFLADVCARRFPSNRARTRERVPFDVDAPDFVDPEPLADNENYDDERRLMYVALTRAERYLFISASGRSRSRFFGELSELVTQVGGTVADGPLEIADAIERQASAVSREDRLATNFSELRYFLECPHDFYLRNVLGFTPTIGQEFGYGRGLHNLLRVIHSNPRRWAELASDRDRLREEVQSLIDRGLFYLRYTTGDPLKNLQRKAVEGVMEYVAAYANELAHLDFEPEKEFETLIADENLLVAGTIDVVRLDDPPRVSIVDFKSGDAEEETGTGLSRELMKLQIGVYGLAARDELEYDPEHGLIRYIGERKREKRQVEVNLDDAELARVRDVIVKSGRDIRGRHFDKGPTGWVENRCGSCDFLNICRRPEAEKSRQEDG